MIHMAWKVTRNYKFFRKFLIVLTKKIVIAMELPWKCLYIISTSINPRRISLIVNPKSMLYQKSKILLKIPISLVLSLVNFRHKYHHSRSERWIYFSPSNKNKRGPSNKTFCLWERFFSEPIKHPPPYLPDTQKQSLSQAKGFILRSLR